MQISRPSGLAGLIIVSTLIANTDACAQSGNAFSLTSSEPPAHRLGISLQHEVDAAISRGLSWLAESQNEDGSWSDSPHPALTALPLWAMLRSDHPDKDTIIDKAIANLLQRRKPDGGIYGGKAGSADGSLRIYNTAICLTALSATDRKDLTPVILKARRFIAGRQHFGRDEYRGGFGYQRRDETAYVAMLTTLHAMQAMRSSEAWEAGRDNDDEAVDIDWSETVAYIDRLQTQAATNGQPAAASNENGTQSPNYFRSYGSMTYAGMLALIYANVTRQDVRVRSALDWAEHQWTLEENPGMGQQGLYFFYNVLTRALDASGVDFIRQTDGSFVHWREEVATHLVSLQRIEASSGDGYWVNTSSQYWENDPVLTTSYALLSLLTTANGSRLEP